MGSEMCIRDRAVHEKVEPAVHIVTATDLGRAAREWVVHAVEHLSGPPHALFLAGNGSTDMIICMHHALYDAHALSELLDDLDNLLNGTEVASRPPFSSLLPSLVADEAAAMYWRETLRDFVPVPLADTRDSRGTSASFTVPMKVNVIVELCQSCLLYTSPSPRDS